MLQRFVSSRLPAPSFGRRLVALVGARQAGKTTLARQLYEGDLRYLDLDRPDERNRLQGVPAEEWWQTVGPAILDEVQKGPDLIEKVTRAYDKCKLEFSVLLGSSCFPLLDQVRESLGGRAFLLELWPLTVAELVPHFGGGKLRQPILIPIVEDARPLSSILDPHLEGVVGPEIEHCRAAVQHILDWGGLPALLECTSDERLPWLEAYQAAYLDRDLADIIRPRDLDAFQTCHRLAAARAGGILSYVKLANDAGFAVSAVRRYLRFLEISYQISCIETWSGDPRARVTKVPKLLWIDGGIQRVRSGQIAGLTDSQYENAIIGQILAILKSLGFRLNATYLRAGGGIEIDLVLENRDLLLAFQFRNRPSVDGGDASPIEEAQSLFGRRYRGGFVVYRGDRVARLTESVYAIPDWFLLGYPA